MVTLYNSSWEIKNVECVLFDKDGTLLDGHVFWGAIISKRANEIIKYYGISSSFFSKLCMSMGYCTSSKKLISAGPVGIAPRETVIIMVVNYLNSIKINASIFEIGNIFNEVHELFSSENGRFVNILPGVIELFTNLKRNKVKIGIVTSDTELNTVNFLLKYQVLNYVDIIIGRETTIEHKNTGVPAKIAFGKLGVNSENVVCIGDAPMDLIMAINSNCLAAIGVLTGQTSENELKQNTQYVTANLIELKIRNENDKNN